MAGAMDATHPVSLTVMPPEGRRRRLTVLLRPLLLIPHALLVGVSVLLLGGIGSGERHAQVVATVAPLTVECRWSDSTTRSVSSTTNRSQNTVENSHTTSDSRDFSYKWHFGGTTAGALGVAASAVAVLDWFSVLFFGSVLVGAQGIKLLYLRWRARVLVYASLLRDEYPPFGEGEYPATLLIAEAPPGRRRGSVFLRPLAVVPHLVVLAILAIFYVITLIACWVLLLIDGRTPPAFWRFQYGVIQWTLRVEAYLLLMHDEYPPFSLAVPPAPASSP
jgi:uncharacterized protein DUF4389